MPLHQHVTNRTSRDSPAAPDGAVIHQPQKSGSPSPPDGAGAHVAAACAPPVHAFRAIATESARIGGAWFHVIDVLARFALPQEQFAHSTLLIAFDSALTPREGREPSSAIVCFTRFQTTTRPRAGDSSPMIMPNSALSPGRPDLPSHPSPSLTPPHDAPIPPCPPHHMPIKRDTSQTRHQTNAPPLKLLLRVTLHAP
jgi:hypothetical protein